jgi:hypothetical protein
MDLLWSSLWSYLPRPTNPYLLQVEIEVFDGAGGHARH